MNNQNNIHSLMEKAENINQSYLNLRDETIQLLNNERKTKLKKTISKGFWLFFSFVLFAVGLITYAHNYNHEQSEINNRKVDLVKENNFDFTKMQVTAFQNSINEKNLVVLDNKKDLILEHTYLPSSFDLLSKDELGQVFSGYTTKIYPIRIKLERFMQDIQGKVDENGKIGVKTFHGGFYVYKNGKRIDEIIPTEEFWINKEDLNENTYTLIAKDIYSPMHIFTAKRYPAWIKDETKKEENNLNAFRGILEFSKDNIINELDIEQYIRGIGESASWTSPEKMKAQAVLARSYAYFYMFSGFKKFKDANYILTDNPANSQKYVGAKVTNGQKWQDAVKSTFGQILIDKEGDLFIAPYSTCSLKQEDGKVRRKTLAEARWGEEKITVNGVTKLKFGHNVLQPVDDSFGECKDKQSGGHGVGLSGNGAEHLAQSGKTFEEIINYYYKGVSLKNIF